MILHSFYPMIFPFNVVFTCCGWGQSWQWQQTGLFVWGQFPDWKQKSQICHLDLFCEISSLFLAVLMFGMNLLLGTFQSECSEIGLAAGEAA